MNNFPLLYINKIKFSKELLVNAISQSFYLLENPLQLTSEKIFLKKIVDKKILKDYN